MIKTNKNPTKPNNNTCKQQNITKFNKKQAFYFSRDAPRSKQTLFLSVAECLYELIVLLGKVSKLAAPQLTTLAAAQPQP
jgi:hypothetical protein